MHTILFDSYRKYQKENKGKFFKVISKLPIGAKFLLGGLVVSFIYSILAIFFPFFKNTYFVSLISQVILCVSSYFYTENFQIKNSDVRFLVYKEYCAEIQQWLVECGIVVTKENITEIMLRIEKEIGKSEKQRATTRERIEKWIQILIIPILLAVFSAIIRAQTDLTVLFTYTLAFLIVIGSLALAFINCYNIFDFFKKRKLEQLKSLCNDLQGVLDCQFDNKLFFKKEDTNNDRDNS